MTDLTLADESVDLVRRWIDPAGRRKPRRSSAEKRLARVLRDPEGLDFTIGFVDRVIRPEDKLVAARNLRTLARRIPRFLSWHQRLLLRVGAWISVILPGIVVTAARSMLRRMVGHLVVDARPAKLGKAISRLRADGDRLNLNLLGEAVLGDKEAARRLEGTHTLLARDDVDYVSVKVSAIASQLSLWAFDASVERVVEQLIPLYQRAAESGKFINLDMEEYRDLDLTIAVFTGVLEHFPELEAGIVLQAYLPDALGAMQQLQHWASERRIAGGAPIKVRVVKGANLAMERVDAIIHAWPRATYLSKQETDTNYKRLLGYAFTPERLDAVRIGVAGQNLFDIAYAWLLAGRRSVRQAIDFEMLLGMASAQAAAVRREVGRLLLYTPVVRPEEFDTAISYLVRRLDENASDDNFMSAAYELSSSNELFEREKQRFIESVKALDEDEEPPARRRNQDRTSETFEAMRGTFTNAPDTDPSLRANRDWALTCLSRSTYTQLGEETVRKGNIPGPASLESLIRDIWRGGAEWGQRDSDIRAWLLHQCATALAARRGELISVMAAETGKTIAEADVEVSEAVDLANYYAEAARRLDAVDGATFRPSHLSVVTPPWNFPVAIPAGSVLSALAAGSGVIIKPAPQARRCSAVMVEALWDAGIPRDVLGFAAIDEGVLAQALVSHSLVDRVILTGSWETAELFRSWRPDLALLAETSGKNAIVVTPSADIDQAVTDITRSAFGHAGQKCSAASLAILVGSVATSQRFHRQLVDAVTSQRVGHPDDPDVLMGPLIEPAQGKLAEALTMLDAGEEWLVEPRQLDNIGRLWSPGVRTGVASGSRFHMTEFFGPVLGIMHARDLTEAIALQNATPYGLTAGLHSLDPDEVNQWIDSVEAGNLYVNRGITGAIVQRQPFGGWKRSSVGTSAKTGGPNYLAHLGSWEPRALRVAADVVISESAQAVLAAAQELVSEDELADLRAAARSDQIAWEREFGVTKDVCGLEVERNVFRYLPVPVTVRFGEEGRAADLVRVLLAAERVGAPVVLSSHRPLPASLATNVTVEDHAGWLASTARARPHRVRLIGSDASSVSEALDGDPDVAIYAGPVTPSGRLEALPFLREQAISITNHRFGDHDAAFDAVLPKRR